LKAISVRQPWAWLLIHGGKDVENRSRPTNFRGRVAIHASKGLHRADWYDALMLIRERGIPAPIEGGGYEIPCRDELDLGAIIGTVEIVDCVTASSSPWFSGPYGYVMRNPQPCGPIQAKGALGLWNWEVPDAA
jgi:hypothetical protein